MPGCRRSALSAVSADAASRAWRRQPNNCCGESPCRRATAQTELFAHHAPATIRALSSGVQLRRRPAPVNSSTRRTGSVIALRSASILNPTVKCSPKITDHPQIRKVGPKQRLSRKRTAPDMRQFRFSVNRLRLRTCTKRSNAFCALDGLGATRSVSKTGAAPPAERWWARTIDRQRRCPARAREREPVPNFVT